MLFYLLLTTVSLSHRAEQAYAHDYGGVPSSPPEAVHDPTSTPASSNEQLTLGGLAGRIMPFAILALLIICYYCFKGEEQQQRRRQQQHRGESKESKQERRAHLESLLIVKKVIAGPKTDVSKRLNTLDHASSASLQEAEGGIHKEEKVDPNVVRAEAARRVDNDQSSQKQSSKKTTQEAVVPNKSLSLPAIAAHLPSDELLEQATDKTLNAEQGAPVTLKQNVPPTDPNDKEDSIKLSTWSNVSNQANVLDTGMPPPRQRRKSNILARTLSKSIRSSLSSTNRSNSHSSCDICLMEYEVGEEICWSPNEECTHGFHKECMLNWLLRNPHCPVCRQDYLRGDGKGQECNSIT